MIKNFDKRSVFGFFLVQPFLGASFYFYNLGFAPAPLLASFVAIIYLLWEKGGKEPGQPIQSIYLVLVVALLFSTIVSFVYVFFYDFSFRPHGLLGIFLGAMSLVAFDRYSKASPDKFVFNVKFFLVVSLLFFYIQFFYFFIFGYEIDYMVNVTGEEQRLIGYSREVEGVGAFKRSSGLFAEPAVYANFTIAVLVGLLYMNRCGVILFFIALASVLLSFSSTGFALSIFPVFLAFRNSNKMRFFIISFLVIFGVVYSDVFVNIFDNEISRLSSGLGDDSGASRLWFVDYVIANPMVAIGGFGVFVDLREVVPPSLFVSSLIYDFGVVGALALFFYFLGYLVEKFDFLGLFLLVILGFIVNYSISSPFFWFIFSVLFVCLRKRPADGRFWGF